MASCCLRIFCLLQDVTRRAVLDTRVTELTRGVHLIQLRDGQASEPGTGKRCEGEGADRLWNLHDITRSCSLFGERESENQTSSKCATLQLLTFCDAWACRNPTLSIATFRCEVRVRISAFCLFLSGLILQAFLSDDQTLLLLYRYSVMLLILSLDKTIDCNIAVGTMVREAKPW